jgi:hypothetical protein
MLCTLPLVVLAEGRPVQPHRALMPPYRELSRASGSGVLMAMLFFRDEYNR